MNAIHTPPKAPEGNSCRALHCKRYRFATWHSALYLLALFALALYFILRNAQDPYHPLEGTDFLLALLFILFGGGAEATALWIFARQRMLHPSALWAGSLLLDLIILLPFILMIQPGIILALPKAAADVLGVYIWASHLLWIAALVIAQKRSCRRDRHTPQTH